MSSSILNDGVILDDGDDGVLTQVLGRKFCSETGAKETHSDSLQVRCQGDSGRGQSGWSQVSNKGQVLKQLMRELYNNGLIIV